MSFLCLLGQYTSNWKGKKEKDSSQTGGYHGLATSPGMIQYENYEKEGLLDFKLCILFYAIISADQATAACEMLWPIVLRSAN